jgi:flagellin
MSSDITLSAGIRQNLLSLQHTADLMAETQNRLATGKKVNSALDNPTNFFTAASLHSRAGDMSALLDNMNTGIRTLETADNGLSSITQTVESMRSTLRQARQDKSFQTGSYTIDPAAIQAGPLGGALTFTGGAFGADGSSASIDIREPVQGSTTSGIPYEGPVDPLGTKPLLVADDPYAVANFDFSAANTIEFSIQGPDDEVPIDITITENDFVEAVSETGKVSVTSLAAVTADEFVKAINMKLAQTESMVRVSNNGGTLEFTDIGRPTTTNSGADASVTIGGADAATLGFSATTTDAGVDGTPTTFEFTIDGTGTPATSTPIVLTSAENTVEKAAAAINEQLGADGVTDITASVRNGRLVISGSADGSKDVELVPDAAPHDEDIEKVFGPEAKRNVKEAVEFDQFGAGVKSVDELVAEINGSPDFQGKIRASNDNGKLRIENLSTQELEVTGISSSGAVIGSATTYTSVGGNSVRANLAEQFNLLRDQLDKFADDASFNGINLLRGDLLKLTFNETGTSTIEIQAKDLDGNERPINTTTLGIGVVSEADLDSDASIDSLLDDLSKALGTLRSQSSNFGSNLSIVENRTEFTKAMINTLQTGADSLVLADTNEEGANMLALQTRQSLSSTALSLASQADQAVLRLFG